MPLKPANLGIFNYCTGLKGEVEILRTEFSNRNWFGHPSIRLGQPCYLLSSRQSAGTNLTLALEPFTRVCVIWHTLPYIRLVTKVGLNQVTEWLGGVSNAGWD